MAKSTVNSIKSSIPVGIGIAIGGVVVGFVLSQLAKRGFIITGA